MIGFVSSPKKILKFIGASEDDLKVLIAKNFVILFESGVIVIRHWRIHNVIQKDRYKETIYTEEKAKLVQDNNLVYNMETKCIQNGNKMETTWQPNDNQMETQVRLGKDRLGKDSLGYNVEQFSSECEEIISYLNKKLKSNFSTKSKKNNEHIIARLKEGFSVEDFKKVIDKKYDEWSKDLKMAQYLRPETLFGTKFEAYLNTPKGRNKYSFSSQRDYEDYNKYYDNL